MAVFGDVRDARARGARARRARVMLAAVERDRRRTRAPDRPARPALRSARSGRCPRRRRCRRSRRRARRTRRRRAAVAPSTAVDRQIAHAQHRSRRASPPASRRAAARRGPPSAAPARRRSSRSSCTRPTTRPSRITVTSSEIASTSDSLCVMMTIVLPCSRMPRRMREELLDFLRREHRGRLVENQQLRVAIERLQQLDALLLADRERLDDGVRDRRPARTRRRARGCAPRPPADRAPAAMPGSAPSTMFSATVIVLDQHEVLMHHADAERDRVVRAADLRGPGRRSGSRRCRPCRSRRRSASRSTCPRRSRRRSRGSCPGSTVMLTRSLASTSPKRLVMLRSSSMCCATSPSRRSP